MVSCDLDIEEPYVNDIDYISKYKVEQAYKKLKKPCIALDAGFYIPSFPNKQNFPGAFPKRDLLNTIGISGLLEAMKDVRDRSCYFKEALTFYDGSEFKVFHAFVNGSLSFKIRGNDTNKKWSDLWYVFVPNNNTKTMAEMTNEERSNGNDGYVSPFAQFETWYLNEYVNLKRDS